ncbi:MAG: globin domain-containing protein [Verrucomicrobiales bacterium]|mgnify:CR=1 FL=1|jgi:hemoglobin|tara:strand:- start:5587 stop:5985 length:399 start_codon:yes stop_codon:yes gene_type:complete
MMNEAEIYRVVGEEGFEKLTASFYKRVKEDDLIGPMYPSNDWEGSEERLREFLLFRFGADQSYLEKRGHPRLRGRHMPFQIGVAERDRWIELMGAAAEETIPDDEIRGSIMAFFKQVADFIRNQPEGEISGS